MTTGTTTTTTTTTTSREREVTPLVKSMENRNTLSGWDVLVAYHQTALNTLLAKAHELEVAKDEKEAAEKAKSQPNGEQKTSSTGETKDATTTAKTPSSFNSIPSFIQQFKRKFRNRPSRNNWI